MKIIYIIINFSKYLLEFFRPVLANKIGIFFFLAGIGLITSGSSYFFSFNDSETNIIFGFSSDEPNYFILVVGFIFLIIGSYMLIKQYLKVASEHIVLYYANVLEIGDSKAPTYAMLKNDKINAVEEYLDLINSYDKDSVIEDYKHNLKSFKNRAKHKDLEKIYLGALGSFPYLYLLGTLLRNGHIQSVVLDYNRNKDKWYRIDETGPEAHHLVVDGSNIKDKISELRDSDSNDIGIALSYTFNIEKSSLPLGLQENTLLLKNSINNGHDKLMNLESQKTLLDELALIIDEFKSVGKNVHLFVSAQASFCVNMGKRYQDNTMHDVNLYNYYNGVRDWYITYDKGVVS